MQWDGGWTTSTCLVNVCSYVCSSCNQAATTVPDITSALPASHQPLYSHPPVSAMGVQGLLAWHVQGPNPKYLHMFCIYIIKVPPVVWHCRTLKQASLCIEGLKVCRPSLLLTLHPLSISNVLFTRERFSFTTRELFPLASFTYLVWLKGTSEQLCYTTSLMMENPKYRNWLFLFRFI